MAILKERWQTLAGIILEEKSDKKDMTNAKCDKCGKGKYIEKDYHDDMDGVLRCSECGHKIKRYKNTELKERTSPEAAQDIGAYFGGSNDSVDGPYRIVADNQPFEDAKHRKKFLKKIRAEWAIKEGKYPATASEYAEELNSKSSSGFKLVTDPEFWAQSGVHTGEELAKTLAIEAYHNAYKDAYGIRPRHADFNNMSIEEIEKRTDELWDEMDEEDSYRDYEEEEYQAQQDKLHKDEDERDEWNKEYDKYEDFELDFD